MVSTKNVINVIHNCYLLPPLKDKKVVISETAANSSLEYYAAQMASRSKTSTERSTPMITIPAQIRNLLRVVIDLDQANIASTEEQKHESKKAKACGRKRCTMRLYLHKQYRTPIA